VDAAMVVLDDEQHVETAEKDRVYVDECAARRLLILWRWETFAAVLSQQGGRS
jgi:hypothetical protein